MVSVIGEILDPQGNVIGNVVGDSVVAIVVPGEEDDIYMCLDDMLESLYTGYTFRPLN